MVADVVSQEHQLRVVEQGTENVITSISLKAGESIVICLQALVNVNGEDKWVDVIGRWNVVHSIPQPEISQCFIVGSDRSVDDTIFVTYQNSNDSIVIAVPLLIKPIIKAVEIRLLHDHPLSGIKYGDTVSIEVRISDEYGLITEDTCFDSVTYIMHHENVEDTLSELIVKGEKSKFGQKIRQCLSKGSDTVKVVLKYSTNFNKKYISVHIGNHTASTNYFLLSASYYKPGGTKFIDNNWFVIHKSGIIQFKQKPAALVTISVLSISGKLVHKGSFIPECDDLQQYHLPLTLPVGYYVLMLNSKNFGSFDSYLVLE